MQGTSTYLYIACASGFKSRTVFFEQFKEKTGFTPQEYIARRQKEAEKKKEEEKEIVAVSGVRECFKCHKLPL